MAALDREPAAPGPLITGFTGGRFRIGTTVFPGALLMTPEDAQPWAAPALAALTAADVAGVTGIAQRPEFLLLGTGATLHWPPRAFVAALEGQGIGVETMDSRAAARAWGVLRGEGRWIVAALLAV